MKLETVYFDLFKSDNIHHSNDSATFLVEMHKAEIRKQQIKILAFFDTAPVGLNISLELALIP